MKNTLMLLVLSICCNVMTIGQPQDNGITVAMNMDGMIRPKTSLYIKKGDTSIKEHTMVVYVDEHDCPSCFVTHLYEWEIFMNQCKAHNIPLNFMFIFSPPEEKSKFMSILSTVSISSMSYIDVGNKFRIQNTWLINNPSKHIFIVDKDKRAIFLDAPPYNCETMMWLRNLCISE